MDTPDNVAWAKPKIHQLVSKHDAVFDAHFAVARIDKASDVFLSHLFVDFVKAHTFWGDIPNQTATRNGINHFGNGIGIAFFVIRSFFNTYFNFGIDA